MAEILLPPVPRPLQWLGEPEAWQIEDSTLRITAGAKTDYFVDPADGTATLNAPMLLFAPDELFTLSASVSVEFASIYDAGVLFVYAGPTRWAKLCFELSPQHQPTVVSVVTNTLSDDCNSAAVTTPQIFLRVTRLGQACAFHYSTNADHWHLVRYFALADADELRVGFEAQSPTGAACTATFSQIAYSATPVANVRSGV